MTDKPLQPFAPPTALTNQLHIPSGAFLTDTLVTWLFYFILAYWVIYTLVAVYHWLRYSHASWIAIPAILVHISVSLALIGYAISGTAGNI